MTEPTTPPCRCHSREGLTPEQHENDCPAAACPECGDTGACNGGPCPLADRQARYAAALAVSEELDWELIKAQYPNDAATYRKNADAVMAVADAEQAELRAEVERLRTDRATVLREAAEVARSAGDRSAAFGDCNRAGAAYALMDTYLHLADEAQQPETEAVATAGPCPDCRHISCRDRTPCNAILSATGLDLARCPCTGQQPNPAPSEEPKDFRAWLGRQHVHGTGTSVRLTTDVLATPAPSEEPK